MSDTKFNTICGNDSVLSSLQQSQTIDVITFILPKRKLKFRARIWTLVCKLAELVLLAWTRTAQNGIIITLVYLEKESIYYLFCLFYPLYFVCGSGVQVTWLYYIRYLYIVTGFYLVNVFIGFQSQYILQFVIFFRVPPFA